MLFPSLRKTPDPARVVITGAGLVTAMGIGCRSHEDGLRSGRSAFGPATLFDVSRQRSKIAAEAKLPQAWRPRNLSPRRVSRLDRAARMLLIAAEEAWSQSGWTGRENLPLVLGTTSGGMALGETYLRHAIGLAGRDGRQPSRVMHYQAQQQALDLFDEFGFQGPASVISNACASGCNAIGEAFEMIREGRAEQVLCGGYDALCQLTFAGFDSLQALSSKPCRPFDAERDGLSLGEGAAVLALEALPYAQKRGAEILGEIAGYGAATDVHHLTQPHPEGNAALAAMSAACRQAGIPPEGVGYVNAHGTGTLQNDLSEAAAINRWAGAAESLLVSSTKALMGHLLGAAGAVEAVITLMALRGQWLPPQLELASPDPACRFRIVRAPADVCMTAALTNSFGFGGANASLALRRWR